VEGDGTYGVIVIDEAFARTFFGDQDPLGQEVTLVGAPARVVGIAASTRRTAGVRPDAALQLSARPL
jgi:MacB-like periplasmic core domain